MGFRSSVYGQEGCVGDGSKTNAVRCLVGGWPGASVEDGSTPLNKPHTHSTAQALFSQSSGTSCFGTGASNGCFHIITRKQLTVMADAMSETSILAA